MALDMNALKSKLNKLKGNNKASAVLWKPQEGKQTVRIVPRHEATDMPFVELYFHYLGNKTYLSPLTHGKPDPIAEFAETIRGDGSNKDSWKIAKDFFPKMRTYVPVVERGKESEGVKWWAFGKTVYQEILAIMADPDYGDITDPSSGRDITVEFTPQEKSDTNFAKTAIRVKPNQTPLSSDKGILNNLLTEQPNIFDVYQEQSYEQLSKVLEDYIGATGEPGSVTSAPAEVADAPAPAKTAKGKPVKDVGAAFDDLFAEEKK
jgi:hypothetical protein